MNAAELTAALVRFDSRNPSLVSGAPGEHQVAAFLADLLGTWGFRVEVQEVVPGRSNVIARGGGSGRGAKSLMLNGHMDVVGTDGMDHPPFTPDIVAGNIYGRGSVDMKSGLAAMCVAARDAIKLGIDGEIVIALVIDEEYESLGTRALIASGVRTDAAVITEPSRLVLCPAHRGFAWARLEVHGRAAHGSRYDLGIDAITRAALIIAELDRMQRTELVLRTHPLLGRGSLHASLISGGSGPSTFADRCTVEIERRTLPTENVQTFMDELEGAITVARRTYPDLDVTISTTASQNASDVSSDAPIMTAMMDALGHEGLPARVEGMSGWTDAALLNEAGIPAICFGPGDIAMAHSATEYVPIQEIEAATRVLTTLTHSWCNTPR
jgi:acetylornithine deacetylase